jgi:hypothetical protein
LLEPHSMSSNILRCEIQLALNKHSVVIYKLYMTGIK